MFKQAALAELRGSATEQELQALNADPGRWYVELVGIKESVDKSLGRKKGELAEYKAECLRRRGGEADYRMAEAEYEEWKSRAVGFKKHVERKMREVRSIKRDRSDDEHVVHLTKTLETTRNLLAVVLNDVAVRSDMSMDDLVGELAVDYPDYAEDLRWIAKVVVPKVVG